MLSFIVPIVCHMCVYLCLSQPTPVVIWHGMGDTYDSERTIGSLTKALYQEIPDIYVRSIRIGNTTYEDFENSYFGNANDQVFKVCKQLGEDKKLQSGYHAIGLSQGSQLLRAVAQRCPYPPMKNFISIGGQHQGVFGFPRCKSSLVCEVARKLLNYGAYWPTIQQNIIQAQYWHNPLNEAEYKAKSIFLADLNNENVINETYTRNLLRLKNIVLVKFSNDSMVIPPESSWFGFYAPGQDQVILPLSESRLYIENRLGLKQLNESGRLHFLKLPGEHLQLPMQYFIDEIVHKFIAPN